jgi:large-conductance mechanosensitive channel
MKRHYFFPACFLFLTGLATSLSGQLAPLKPITAPQTAKFAQPFVVYFKFPAAGVLAQTELKDFSITEQNAQSGGQTALKVIPFNIGKLTFPELTFKLNDGGELKTEPFPIEIMSVRSKHAARGLIDIREPRKLFNWGLFLTLIAIFLIIGYIFYSLANRRVNRTSLINPMPEDKRPADIIALEQIANLLGSGCWESQGIKFFYVKLIDITREYLSARFKINSQRYTSRELENRLARLPEFKSRLGQQSVLRLLKRFHSSADLVKFANVRPTQDERNCHVRDARDIIEQTKEPVRKEADK